MLLSPRLFMESLVGFAPLLFRSAADFVVILVNADLYRCLDEKIFLHDLYRLVPRLTSITSGDLILISAVSDST